MTIDTVKLDVSLTYIRRMAEGLDPVTNRPAEEDSVINNPNVIRCMYFVQDVLEAVKEQGGYIGTKRKKGKVPFPFEILKEYRYENDKSISYIMSQIRDMVDDPNVKMISYKPITDWFKAAGYLAEQLDVRTGKKATVSTEEGKKLGIYMEERRSVRGDTYNVVVYDRNAQEFLIKNMEAILNGEVIEGCGEEKLL